MKIEHIKGVETPSDYISRATFQISEGSIIQEDGKDNNDGDNKECAVVVDGTTDKDELGAKENIEHDIDGEPGDIKYLTELHLEMGHASRKTMEHKIKGHSKIKGLRKKLKKVILKCLTCQMSGFGQIKKETISVKVDKKNDLWEFDLVGPLPRSKQGYLYLLRMIDHETKKAEVDRCAQRRRKK